MYINIICKYIHIWWVFYEYNFDRIFCRRLDRRCYKALLELLMTRVVFGNILLFGLHKCQESIWPSFAAVKICYVYYTYTSLHNKIYKMTWEFEPKLMPSNERRSLTTSSNIACIFGAVKWGEPSCFKWSLNKNMMINQWYPMVDL